MSFIESLILGIIQGLTEFLPVSSSGHLELGKAILGDNSLPEESLLFTVVVHAATALSTIVVYRKDIFSIGKGALTGQKEELSFAIKIVLSMIPAAIIGVVFNDQIEALFSKNILLVGLMLLITGVLLYFADKAKNTNKDVSFTSAIIIGIAQAIAIAPGISRSGATISTSVLLGIDKEKSARFSFLMVVPLILGKIAKDLLDSDSAIHHAKAMPLIVGFVAAFITGLVACTWMIKLVKKGRLVYFAIYCLLAGTISIIISLL